MKQTIVAIGLRKTFKNVVNRVYMEAPTLPLAGSIFRPDGRARAA